MSNKAVNMDLYILKVPNSIYKLSKEEIIFEIQSNYNIEIKDIEKYALAHNPGNRYIKISLDNEIDHMKLVALRDIKIFHAFLPIRPKHGSLQRTMSSSDSMGFKTMFSNQSSEQVLGSSSFWKDSSLISRHAKNPSSVWEDSISSSISKPFSHGSRLAPISKSIWEDSNTLKACNPNTHSSVLAPSHRTVWEDSIPSSKFQSIISSHASHHIMNSNSLWDESISPSPFKTNLTSHTNRLSSCTNNVWDDSTSSSSIDTMASTQNSGLILSSKSAWDGMKHGQICTSPRITSIPINAKPQARQSKKKLPRFEEKRDKDQLQCARVICETLSNGVNNPEAFVDYFNDTIVNMGYSRIPVPKDVIDHAYKNLKTKTKNTCRSIKAPYTI